MGQWGGGGIAKRRTCNLLIKVWVVPEEAMNVVIIYPAW